MPTGNITWSDMTPEEEARRKKWKKAADELGPDSGQKKGVTDAGKVPDKLQLSGNPARLDFAGLKAYNTRSRRSNYSK